MWLILVKGVTRRVIVVRSPDPRFFEEAIFIVREGPGDGVSYEELLKEAQNVANCYVKNHVYKRRVLTKIPPSVLVAAGALFSGLVFLIANYIFWEKKELYSMQAKWLISGVMLKKSC